MGLLESFVGVVALYVYFFAYFMRDATWIAASVALVIVHTICSVYSDRDEDRPPNRYNWLSSFLMCGAIAFFPGPVFAGQVVIVASSIAVFALAAYIGRRGQPKTAK